MRRNTHEKENNCVKMLVAKLTEKKLLVRPRRRWEVNIKVDHEERE